MDMSYFTDQELNKLPCGIVAFSNHAPWTIIHANDMYFSHFSNNNIKTLNIFQEDAPSLNSLAPRLRQSESANLLYRAYSDGEESKKIVMTASKYGDDAFLGVLWDATDRSKMIEEVQAEKEKFAIALCNSKNIVFEHNLRTNEHIMYVPVPETNTVETIRERNTDSTISDDLIYPEDKEFFLANMYNPEEKMLAARMKMPHDSDWKWYRTTRQFEFDEDGNLFRIYGVISDIDEEKMKEAELREEVEIDPILKIYYRNAAVKRINQYFRNNPERRDYALFVMDIDNFKDINDTFGHLYGDTVIEMVASVLKDINPNFSIPGRYGGDEFFVFLYALSDEEVKEAADSIMSRLSEVHLADGRKLTCSVGISLGALFKDTPDYKEMFEKADKALYSSKKNGKAQWRIYDSSMDTASGRAIDYEVDESNSPSDVESKDLMKAFLELSAAARTSEGAIYSIIKYIIAKFDFDWMQVMQVNSVEDLITIRYEWSRDPDFHNNAGRSGYYIHSDIMRFRNHFEQNPIFSVIPENTEGFSPKFQREFEKNLKYNIIYISDTTSDDSFYMFTCIRFDKDREWTQEEFEGLNTATKIMTMFISQTGKESEREKELQRLVDYDSKTGLYTSSKFYEQLGRLRKLATENGDEIILFHTDFGNFINVNLKYGYRAGDEILHEFGTRIRSNTDPERCVSMHVNGTDMFLSAFRISEGDRTFIEKYKHEDVMFCEEQNKKYPDTNMIIRVGVYKLKPDEEGGVGFDKALMAKKKSKNRDHSFYVWYEDEE